MQLESSSMGLRIQIIGYKKVGFLCSLWIQELKLVVPLHKLQNILILQQVVTAVTIKNIYILLKDTIYTPVISNIMKNANRIQDATCMVMTVKYYILGVIPVFYIDHQKKNTKCFRIL